MRPHLLRPHLLRPHLRWLVPALLLPLFGCGAPRGEFAPACPSPRLIPSLAELTRYAGPGPAHDLTDLIVQARITAVNGSCTVSAKPSILPAVVRISITVQRGPAMQGRAADVPVFLAVVEGEDVRDKQVFPVHVEFPPNVDRVSMTSPDITLNLPVGKNVSGASYGLIAGFQLTPDELNTNRQTSGR
ncbi:MAG TPA: hypothetical protein PLD10_13360 [Rhodopila sp.]|nr:hypothetical protein [Rhodopila sp.]